MRRPCRASEANTLSVWLCCRSKVTIGGSKQVWFEMSLECWSRLLLLDLRSVGNWFPWRGAALQKALSPIFHHISTFITADTLSRIMRLTLSCSEGILVMLGTLTSTTSISLCKSSKQKLVRTQFVFFDYQQIDTFRWLLNRWCEWRCRRHGKLLKLKRSTQTTGPTFLRRR